MTADEVIVAIRLLSADDIERVRAGIPKTAGVWRETQPGWCWGRQGSRSAAHWAARVEKAHDAATFIYRACVEGVESIHATAEEARQACDERLRAAGVVI